MFLKLWIWESSESLLKCRFLGPDSCGSDLGIFGLGPEVLCFKQAPRWNQYSHYYPVQLLPSAFWKSHSDVFLNTHNKWTLKSILAHHIFNLAHMLVNKIWHLENGSTVVSTKHITWWSSPPVIMPPCLKVTHLYKRKQWLVYKPP